MATSLGPAILGTGIGVREVGLDAATLPRWSSTEPIYGVQTKPAEDLGPLAPEPTQERPSKFPFRPELNEKVVVWQGNICKLKIDAIVNSTNETLNDRTGISGDIFVSAGGQLEDECNALEGCRTGEAKSTRAYNLPCERIIHTAGPRFNVKYRTAAENALHSSYRNCMQELTELGLRSIAFCCINSEKKGYPREAAAHIAARTVRRFLEHHTSSVDLVVFCLNNTLDLDVYNKVLPLYMPRSIEEQNAAVALLPEDTGNEYGESVCEERRIRIGSLPGNSFNEAVSTPSDILQSVQDSFGAMKEDPDANRIGVVTKTKAQKEEDEKELTYARYLQRARAENLSDLEHLNILHVGGTDEMGRTVISVVAGHFPASSNSADSPDHDRLLLYLIRELDVVVERDFVLVFFHTPQGGSERQVSYTWIKKALSILTRKYRKNVKALYIVHPNMWMKMLFWFLTPFVTQKFWQKLVYVDKLAVLFRHVNPTLLKVPKFVKDFDTKTWGEPATKQDYPEDRL